MIPMELWMSDEMKQRRWNAATKALKEKPKVEQEPDSYRENDRYRVKDQYDVHIQRDADGRYYIECSCAAGSPPVDEATGLPSREPAICYHASAVLIHIAEQEDGKR